MRVAVFTGSQAGPPSHRRLAAAFGADLARAGVGIVYGGGNVGLMGVVASAAELLAFVDGYEHPARKWTSEPPPAA